MSYNPEFQRDIDRICAEMDRDRFGDDGSVFWVTVSVLAGLMVWVALAWVIWP